MKCSYLNEVPALRCLFRAQNGFKLFALFSLESLDSSRSPSPYQPESATANNSNKLKTLQDHDVRNLITSWADHKHMFGAPQHRRNFFPLRNSRKFTPKFPDFFSKWKAPENSDRSQFLSISMNMHRVPVLYL